MTKRIPLEVRFWRHVQKTDTCWLWVGTRGWDGYGRISVDRRLRPVHRISYELSVGPIPEGLHLDHLCRVRNCVNPDHLEPVTCQVNLLRGETRAAANAVKTHCPKGHPYDVENTIVDKRRGIRGCRTCARRRTAEWKRRTNYSSRKAA